MADVYLTQRDIDYISRVVATEVPPSLAQSDPAEYSRMVNAVVDTITNRMASGEFPSTATDVLNQNRQFSKITGPSALDPYGSVQAAPNASPELQSMVASHIADISQGLTESEIGGSVNYANPNFSSANNLRDWVNPMIEAGALKLGIGDMVHYHGIIPGDEAVGPYGLSAEGIPTSANVAVPVNNPMKGLLSVVDPYDPNASLRTGSLMAPVPTDWGAMAQANQQVNPGLLGSNIDVLTASRQNLGVPTEMAAADDAGWGLNRDVAPVPISTFNQWDAVASAQPVQAPVSQPMDIAATGLLGGTNPFSAQATVPGQEVSSINPGLLSSTSMTDMAAPMSFTSSTGILSQPMANPGYMSMTAPVKEMPQIAEVQGPATTPAEDQQQAEAVQQITTPNLAERVIQSAAVPNPGLLSQQTAVAPQQQQQGLVNTAQPSGGGFLGGLLSSPSYGVNPIGSGVQAAYSIWGGGNPIGSQAIASDGSRITQMPGGLIGITGPSGVTTAFDSTGKGYSVWGGIGADPDTEGRTSGGFLGGLLG